MNSINVIGPEELLIEKEEGNAMIQKKPEVKDFGIAQLTVKFASDMGVRNDENLGMLKNCLKDKSEVDLCGKSINKKSAGYSSSSSCLPLTSTIKYEGKQASTVSGKGSVNFASDDSSVPEAYAYTQGSQTIKNDDIRELVSGTYRNVYYGKWKGSDVAVKRIKASCFTDRRSEQQRMRTDFWREAIILSKLHHFNVVASYGIVINGPDGILATVTEYILNGSLKQVPNKEDRTTDRCKRLFIARDAVCGMQYLQNIVHFDLKWDNLMIDMKIIIDPFVRLVI
jgi:hypothetical protein